jgi:DNA modification methylase
MAVTPTILPQPDRLDLGHTRTCACPANHLNCLTAKEWMKHQIGVWQFRYESRDIRDKAIHPATFPLALANKCIGLFTHEGELVLDPFVGSGTTLLAARDLDRNAAGFDLNAAYINLSRARLAGSDLPTSAQQLAVQDDARQIRRYLEPETVSLILTSPPYANLLNRKRKNKSRRGDLRQNDQYGKVEQYSQDPSDLGTLPLEDYRAAIAGIFAGLLPLLKPKGHCVINVPDMWWEDERITIHIAVVEALRSAGYALRNTIIWDRTNIVNKIGIFGWPSNYITMGTTFEYLLDFWKPPSAA